MALDIVPGPLISSLHISAGFAACGGMLCAVVALSGFRRHVLWWLAALCVVAAGFQIFIAAYHQATTLEAAINAQRWQNVCVLTLLFLVTGFFTEFVRARHRTPLLLGMGAVCLALLAFNFAMPFGVRFSGMPTPMLISFSWGERLLVLHGDLSVLSMVARLLFFSIFGWGMYIVWRRYAAGERVAASVLGLGMLGLLCSIALSALIERGEVDFIYIGGFGFIFFAGLGQLLILTELREADTRLGAATQALHHELDNHRQTQKVVQHLSLNDALTDLPSRAGLFERIRQPIEAARRKGGQFAVLLIDIDRFDLINDTLGQTVGDRLLQQVAARLSTHMEGEDFVARMNADEFICVVSSLSFGYEARRFASRLHEVLRQTFAVDEHFLHVTASIGIALYPADGVSAGALLTAADLATREAKRKGGNQTQFFREELDAAIRERMHIGNALRVALAEGQFELYFQPQVSVDGGRISSVEALIRWHHPTEGLIEPQRFIPIAEEMHMIVPIGAWVIEEACRVLAEWRQADVAELRVAVNLSAQQLHQPELHAMVADALARHGLSGHDLEIEITESMVMEDPEACVAQLRKLSNLGVALAMDDFGTGYSSLAYLKRLPIDTLKIDRSFVKDIETNPNDAAICATTISMATTMGLGTVAEGVETEVQAGMLRDLNCGRFQGFLYARPMPMEAAREFVRGFGANGLRQPA